MNTIPTLAVIGLLMMAGATAGGSVVDTSDPTAIASGFQPDGTAGAVDTTAVAPVTASAQENATNALRIPREELNVTRIEQVTISVGDTVAMDTKRIHTGLAATTFEAQFADAETAAARRAVVRNATRRLDNRTTALQREARAAHTRFNNGGSAYVYLATLARLSAEADALEQDLTVVQRRGEQVESYEEEGELTAIRTELRRFQGPVPTAVAEAFRGEAASMRVYVATSADAVVLATIVDGEYQREVYVTSERQRIGPRTVNSISEASTQVNQTYSWAWRNQLSLTVTAVGPAGAFAFGLQSPQGQLDAYVDARSGKVYREIQVIPLATRYLTAETSTDGDLQLTVHRSYGGGPLRVRLLDRTTETRVNRTVFINGERVGVTGTDGTLWTLAPHQVESVRIGPARGDESTPIAADTAAAVGVR